MANKKNTAWLKTMVKKHGSKKEVQRIMRERAAKGGRNGKGTGFALNPELAIEAGRKGGKISKRKKTEQRG